ncbi:MAG TPA: hypothetical protein VFW66_02005 [Gemmatimonadales bacterium]|nr:hypothetical protein [Gemmatimonadales bacterium]
MRPVAVVGRALAAAAFGLGGAILVAAACHRTGGNSPGAQPDAAAADTITGQVRLVGVSGKPRVTLVPDSGGSAMTLTGAPALERVNGLSVAAVGRAVPGAEPRKFQVREFTVVAANGLAATDGRLAAGGDTLYLVTADGTRHPLVNPSPNLWAHVGSRVWVSGPINQEPVAYGIIE